ncbi:unnamed protein product [Staurois parvus]|uniref:Uncharacterized protein n=1 Tax=Staurois parvus TaxID=386267 RepID=A0ABN9DSQ2_9NEOB|nr:unnamed protein product [Staurois parvus]
MGPLCPCPNSKKPMKKVPGLSHRGPLLTLGPQAVPEFPNGQSAAVSIHCSYDPFRSFFSSDPFFFHLVFHIRLHPSTKQVKSYNFMCL